MIKTVLIVDLVGYSGVARTLEENLRTQLVAELNEQIQGFIDRGLMAASATRGQNVNKTTGDGAILLFDTADQAHRCALEIHQAAAGHNDYKTDPLAKRYFRMGAATGEVIFTPDGSGREEIAGMTIARAERLQAAAEAGEILVDKPTFKHLSAAHQQSYRDEEKVRGKRTEQFVARRCQVVTDVDEDFKRLTAAHERDNAWLTLVRNHPLWTIATVVVVLALGLLLASTLLGGPPPIFPGGNVLAAFEARDALKEDRSYVPPQLEWLERAILLFEDQADKRRATKEIGYLKMLQPALEDFQQHKTGITAGKGAGARANVESLKPLDSGIGLLEKLVTKLRDAVNNKEQAEVFVYRSHALPAALKTTLTCDTFAGVDNQIDVVAMVKRGDEAIPIDVRFTQRHNIFSLDLQNIEPQDELWVVVFAHSKSDLPGSNRYDLKETGR